MNYKEDHFNQTDRQLKTTLKAEEAGKFILAWFLTVQLGFSWWMFLAWLLAPDISIAAYLFGTRAGSAVYNFFHHQGLSIAVGLAGLYLQNNEIMFAGILIFGHSSMDRMIGYGLKYPDNFKHTHLGWIGGH